MQRSIQPLGSRVARCGAHNPLVVAPQVCSDGGPRLVGFVVLALGLVSGGLFDHERLDHLPDARLA